jgi:myo-inositol 2-dehydrogenase/D-chiro-inositol 1-dehydrogenase
MRLGLLGLGRIGEFHADTLASLPMVDSLVVADIIPSLTKKVAERVRAEPAASPDALLKSGLDGVVIAASTDAHPELIVAAIDAGLPVFCEKPLARTIAEGVEVLQRVQASDVPVQIGYQRRFDAAYQAAHDAVAHGELGWLHTVRSTTLDPAPPTPEYVAASGGIFRDCGVHDFDIIRWVTGREVVEVYATGSNRGAEFFAAAGDVDTAAAVLTLDDGAWRWCPTPATTRAATTSGWRCTAPRTASRSAWRRSCRCARSSPWPPSRPACRTGCSWTGSCPPTRPSWTCSLSSSPGTAAPRARSRTPWKPT